MASFEQQLGELEKVVAELERGDLTLEENVKLFERGMALSEACKAELEKAESRIQVLMEAKQNGEVKVRELAVEDEGDEDVEEEGGDDQP
jgi:exodeoxyribonuclease VII small subunit